MRTRGEEDEILVELRRIRELNKEFTTNLYAAPEQLRNWAGQGVLSLTRGSCTTLLFRRDRHFEHLYHVAASRTDLAEALASLDPIPGLPIVTDLVGPPENVAPVAEIYRENGFEDYVDLVRMMRPGDRPPMRRRMPVSTTRASPMRPQSRPSSIASSIHFVTRSLKRTKSSPPSPAAAS